MIRVLPILFAGFFLAGCEREQKNDEASGRAELAPTVVGYRFALPGDEDPGMPVPSGFSLIKQDGTVDFDQLEELKRKQATLSEAQIAKLEAAVYSHESKTSAAACYDPHHIFLFYDESGDVTKIIEICFSCTNIRTQPELSEEQWYRHDFRALARLCDEIGIGLGSRTAEQFIEILDERERL